MDFKKYFYWCLALGLLVSCNENTNTEELNVDMGLEYFPLTVGKYIVYQLDSITYDITASGTIRDTVQGFLKEEIIDTSFNNLGAVVAVIQRSVKADWADAWEVKDIWQASIVDNQAQKVEENLRFIKLVFPATAGTTWNGNIFIPDDLDIAIAGERIDFFKNWSYEIESVGKAEIIGGKNFEEVATVFQADNENLIELRYSMEKYAKNVGLVYRELKILDTQDINSTEPWEVKAKNGLILRQELLEHN
ncbi:MAG: hypothetical protein AB8G15_21890 [Saprospiraceae bacterium]